MEKRRIQQSQLHGKLPFQTYGGKLGNVVRKSQRPRRTQMINSIVMTIQYSFLHSHNSVMPGEDSQCRVGVIQLR